MWVADVRSVHEVRAHRIVSRKKQLTAIFPLLRPDSHWSPSICRRRTWRLEGDWSENGGLCRCKLLDEGILLTKLHPMIYRTIPTRPSASLSTRRLQWSDF